MRGHAKKIGNHAVVIGASIGGLLAGRVLSDYFDKVTIIDRDILPDQPIYRKGVPQSHHLHALLIRGQRSLERYFPDFISYLDKDNIPTIHWLNDVRFLFAKGWLPRIDVGLTTRSCTRPKLEFVVREGLNKIDNITFVDGCEVTSLLHDENRKCISGIGLRWRHKSAHSDEIGESLDADFVVDASGRDSDTPTWLKQLGYEAPEEVVVNSFLGYASRIYSELSAPVEWTSVLITPTPPDQPRSGVIALVEDGKWSVLLSGAAKQYPPTDEEGFLEFAKSLNSPMIYEAIKDGKPASDIYGYQRTANVMRLYEKLTNWPRRFAVLGDAVCCFNPVYGQGMTVSALAAETLDKCLGNVSDIDSLGQEFQKQVAKTNALPWLMATGADFLYPQTEGKRPSGSSQYAQAYLWRLQEIMPRSPSVSHAFLKVLHMVDAPLSLLKPNILLQVVQSLFRS